MVLQGAARLAFEDQVVELVPGDWINIPAHQKHRVEWTSPDEPTVWLAMFYR
jgi:cupin 2 domain-containing protein